ncbi:Ribonuclease Z, mitochondrial [Pseudolycoriella hygida]|uniref:Zinc phosphodiesterase ELAC protein 2 n=1 Tax=Pseudolycoriella hygida TaxID=35572 RepID=A0A9Q0NE55_9DIPT|nr:Ribonuclease Z, mitochondrial [Pseudolycoriella hygida]
MTTKYCIFPKSMKFPVTVFGFVTHSVKHSIPYSTKLSNKELQKMLLQMPRDTKYVSETQKQRLKIKERCKKYIPGTVNVQVVGSGSLGSPASVYLFTDQQRYLFNCGEGTQRLSHEHKTKLARLEHIFMTRTTWDRTGGLPGLALTLQDNGVPSVTLHGPDGLGDIFKAMQRFVILKNLKVEAPTCEDGIIHDDQVLTIRAISFNRNITDNEQQNDSPPPVVDDTDYYSLEKCNDNGEISVSSTPVEQKEESAKRSCGSTVMAFLCRLKPRAGRLDLVRCVEKNVPPGPLFAQLKSGNSITLPNGTTVHSKDVCHDSDPGPIFIIIDIPSVEFLNSLEDKEDLFTAHQKTAASDDDMASLVIHFSPPDVIDDPVYQDFMNKFDKKTKHLVLNETNKFSGFLSSHRIQIQLNQLNDKTFPILAEYESQCRNGNVSSNKKVKYDESIVQSSTSEVQSTEEHLTCEQVSASTYYHLRPHKGLDRLNELVVNYDEYIGESAEIPGFLESLDDLKQQLRQSYVNEKTLRGDEYPKILFLGTGSCIPNKTRNVSAILVHTTSNSSILLDCGEGTFGQMIRFYGKDKTREVLKNLKAIYVSHMHADHHLGLIGILEGRRRLLNNAAPIMLLAPWQISSFLDFYNRRIDSIRKEYFLVPNGDLLEQPLNDARAAELGLNFISTCLVRHCPHAYGIAFEISADEPFKITYSGDTIPCEELVRLGKNSTLLIHEATMEDDLEEQARYKMHSTVSQAVSQGVKMNAKYTLLTHFSQRYAKLPRLEEEINKNVCIAFDNMEVTSVDLEYFHLLYPTLKVLFNEHCQLLENKALKRVHREQRVVNFTNQVVKTGKNVG